MVPAFLEDSGSLGAILAARISTKLHLGTLEPGRGAWRAATDDVLLIYMYAIPVFVFLGASSIVVAGVANKASPGVVDMMGVALLAGLMATTAAVIVGYYAAVATYRFGLDPRQLRSSDGHIEPGPARRVVAYPGHRDHGTRLMPTPANR
jgi:mgtE-like transporter